MINYIIRRILYAIPITIGVSLIVFVLFNMVGGDVAYQLLPKGASQEALAQIRKQLGTDQPYHVQYLRYVGEIVRFDFGRSWETKQKISEMFSQGIGPSFKMALPIVFFGFIWAVAFSALSAFYARSLIDRFLVLFSVLGMSISILAFIIAGQYFLAYKMEWFPISGYEHGLRGIAYLALPVLIGVVGSLGDDVRFYRTVFLEELHKEYVLTARSKGLSNITVMLKHVLKNAMIPIVTRMVMVIPYLFLGSLLLENFFGIPGLGNMGINAINASDLPVIKALVFVSSLLYILANLLGDILYSVFDPRVRLE